MRPIARGIVRYRKLVLLLAVILLIPALLGTAATRINYDILTYLPPELDLVFPFHAPIIAAACENSK